jgi:hypothetical protein
MQNAAGMQYSLSVDADSADSSIIPRAFRPRFCDSMARHPHPTPRINPRRYTLRTTPVLVLTPPSPSPILLQPLLPQKQPSLPQPLQLTMDLLLLKRNAIRLLRLGPEIGHREAVIEVLAVVVHDCDWEHDVHAELFHHQHTSDREQGRRRDCEMGREIVVWGVP